MGACCSLFHPSPPTGEPSEETPLLAATTETNEQESHVEQPSAIPDPTTVLHMKEQEFLRHIVTDTADKLIDISSTRLLDRIQPDPPPFHTTKGTKEWLHHIVDPAMKIAPISKTWSCKFLAQQESTHNDLVTSTLANLMQQPKVPDSLVYLTPTQQ